MRSAGGLRNSSSSARCTSDPFVVAWVGGSGSFSMLANRNARGHDRNDSTRDGDRLVGTVQVGPSAEVSSSAVTELMLARLYARAVTLPRSTAQRSRRNGIESGRAKG